MRDDEKKLWNTIWERKHNKGIIPARELAEEFKIPLRRMTIILQKWLGLCLINCGMAIWDCWIEKGVKKEDLKGIK